MQRYAGGRRTAQAYRVGGDGALAGPSTAAGEFVGSDGGPLVTRRRRAALPGGGPTTHPPLSADVSAG